MGNICIGIFIVQTQVLPKFIDMRTHNGEEFLPTNDVGPSAATASVHSIESLPRMLNHLRHAVMQHADEVTNDEFAGTILTSETIHAEKDMEVVVEAWEKTDLYKEEGMDETAKEIYDDLQMCVRTSIKRN